MKKNSREMRMRQLYRRIRIGIVVLVTVLVVLLLIVNALKSGRGKTEETASTGTASAEAAPDAAAAGENEISGETVLSPEAEGGTAASEAMPEKISIKVSAVGDCTLGTDDSFDYDTSFNAAFYDADYPGWFLENCQDYFGDDDLTIVNFEGVLSKRGEREDKTYAFRGDPEFVKVLTEGSVEAANLANNHAFDYGTDAYEDTKEILTDAGITNFGYDRSMVIDVKGVKVGLTGTLALYDERDAKDGMVEQIKWCHDQGAQLIISSIHWGDEGQYYQADWQEYLGRAAVDAGADLVIGHHPHRLQPYEIYNGKVILYSLGNFCFGGNRVPSDMDSAIYQQTFTFENGELTPDLDYRIVPCSISSASGYNNYQPTPLYGDDADRVKAKIAKIS